MDYRIFEDIGLTKGETAVYLAMLELGSVTVKPIVDKSKVSYSKIYDILERLIDKGVVSYVIKDNKKYFEAAPVEKIMDYIKEKEKRIIDQKEKLSEILPQLKLRQQKSGYAAESTIYKGIKGLKTAFSSSMNRLNKNQEILIISNMNESESINIFFHNFIKDTIKKRLRIRTLSNEEDKSLVKWPKKRYVQHTIPATIALFNDIVIIFPKSEDIVLFVINSKEVAESFKIQFEEWWEQRVRTYEGIEALRTLWMEKLQFGGYCGLGEGIKIVKTLGEDFFINWQKEKNKRNIIGKVIIGEKYRKSVTVKKSIAKFKFISGHETPGATEIFKDRIIVINFSKKPIAFVINDPKIAQSHQTYFNYLWKIAKK